MRSLELKNCLRRMISIQDPMSMEQEEIKGVSDAETYHNATHNQMKIAYNELSGEITHPLQSDLLDFLVDTWLCMKEYRKTGELWERFGDTVESQLVTINVEDPHQDNVIFQRFTKSDLVRFSSKKDNPNKELAALRLSAVSSIPVGWMMVTFYDPKKQQLHGFPFDISFVDASRANFQEE